MHLVGFIIRNLTRCTVTWTSKLLVTSPHLTSPHLTLCVPITYRRCRWCRSVKPCSGSSLLTTCDDSADDTHSHKDGVNQRLLPPTRHSMILRGFSRKWPTITPWCRVLIEKLTGSQPVKKSPTFYGNRRFITTFTGARHLSLSSASCIHSIPPHPTSRTSILTL